MKITIEKFKAEYRNDLIRVWEKSVRASHHFLTKNDLTFYRSAVEKIDFHSFDVYCVFNKSKHMIGVFGIEKTSLEMLFVMPGFTGKGVGSMIMEFAMKNHGITSVDVNEENTAAVAFYKKFGFSVYDRRLVDDHGKPHPILKLRLSADVANET